MPSTNTSNLNLEKPADGEQSGEWGDTINSNMELIDAAVATKTGSETLTNKTLTSPILNTGASGTAIKDEDNMASDSATHLATQQSIKAYVDSQSASEEEVEDIVGAMTTSNTETGIAVTYQDADGTLDFVVSDTTVSGDTGSTGITPGDTLTVAGGTNVSTAMSGDTLTITATTTDTTVAGDSGSTGITPGDTLTIAGGANITTAMSGDTLTVTGSASGALADLDIDGGTDIGEALVDADLFIVDNGANGTNRKSALSRLKTYVTSDNTLTLYKFTATAGQTTFTGNDDSATSLAYTAGALFVTLNGSVLENGTDYTATNGTSIVLTDAAALSDELNVYAFGTFNVATVTGASGDFSIADDLSFTSDAAKISFGANNEIELVHHHDKGLYLKDTADDATGPKLTFQTGNTTVTSGDYLGEILFQAPDEASGTDAIIVGASIRAKASDTFAADNNETDIQFLTAQSGARTVKMYLQAGGGLHLGAGNISGSNEEAGWQFHNTGRIYQSSGVAGWIMNDSSASGATYNYIVFRHQGSQIGDIDTTDNTTIRYQTFTGAHWSQFSDGSQAELKLGTVLSTVSDLITWTEFDYTDADGEADIVRAAGHDYTIGNTYNIPVDERGNTGNCVAKRKKTPERLPKCKVSDTAGDTAIYGVFSGHYARGESSVEALGSGAILIGSGVSLNIGDLLESAGDGTARPQTGSDATVFKSSTIGKVTSTTKIDTHSDGSYTVPCTLHCG